MSELVFSRSGHTGVRGNRVEVAFRKSSYSAASHDCVEVADLPTGTAIRDSRNPHAGHIDIPRREWAVFLDVARG